MVVHVEFLYLLLSVTSIKYIHRCNCKHDRNSLFARVLLCTLCASLAMHTAAPMKFTSALPRSCELMRVVTTTAAHQIASVSTYKNNEFYRIIATRWFQSNRGKDGFIFRMGKEAQLLTSLLSFRTHEIVSFKDSYHTGWST